MLMLVDEHAEVLADVDQGALLVGQLEFDLAHVARVLAAAGHEILDRDLGDGGGLFAGQPAEIEKRIPVAADAQVILHVGEADQRQFPQHLVLGDFHALRTGLERCVDGRLDLGALQ